MRETRRPREGAAADTGAPGTPGTGLEAHAGPQASPHFSDASLPNHKSRETDTQTLHSSIKARLQPLVPSRENAQLPFS